MTVFVAHTEADEETASALAKVLERRGNFVEHEEAERIGRPLQSQDALVLLWSQAMMFDPGRLVMERRALDAWADGKLVVVMLDRTFLPVGLRDLATIDATFDQRRTFTWEDVATRVRELLQTGMAAPAGAASTAVRAPAPKASAPRQRSSAPSPGKGGGGGLSALILLILTAVGLWQVMARFSFTLPLSAANAALDDFVLPPWSVLGVAALAAFIALVVALMRRDRARAQAKRAAPPMAADYAAPEPPEAPAPPVSSALFVSYAHADGPSVAPVVAEVKHQGREVWMDKEGISAGEGWAGEIVRAIRAAHGVLVMCSTHAFESDHVKREVYLADRYKKPMLPVFLEAANLPEDFEYFFAGVQSLELHNTPEADRAAAIARAVASV